MSNILIAGATGYLGRYVTRAFKKEGHWVRVLVRDPEKLRRIGPRLEPAIDDYVDDIFVGDVTRPESLRGCGDGIDVVFSSVGITRPQKGATFRDVDYQGNLNLLNEVRDGPSTKFIYVSVFEAIDTSTSQSSRPTRTSCACCNVRGWPRRLCDRRATSPT